MNLNLQLIAVNVLPVFIGVNMKYIYSIIIVIVIHVITCSTKMIGDAMAQYPNNMGTKWWIPVWQVDTSTNSTNETDAKLMWHRYKENEVRIDEEYL